MATSRTSRSRVGKILAGSQGTERKRRIYVLIALGHPHLGPPRQNRRLLIIRLEEAISQSILVHPSPSYDTPRRRRRTLVKKEAKLGIQELNALREEAFEIPVVVAHPGQWGVLKERAFNEGLIIEEPAGFPFERIEVIGKIEEPVQGYALACIVYLWEKAGEGQIRTEENHALIAGMKRKWNRERLLPSALEGRRRKGRRRGKQTI